MDFSNTRGIIFKTVTGLNQGMELFDHPVPFEKSETDCQFFLKGLVSLSTLCYYF
jgi:hypothetical protein